MKEIQPSVAAWWEQGKATTFASLMALAAATAYIKVGHRYLADFPPVYDTLVLATLLIVCFFTIGCLIHMILIGEPSQKEFWRTVHSAAKDIEQLSIKTTEQIERLEFRCANLHGPVKPTILSRLTSARRIASALERRAQRVKLLLEIGKADMLSQAYELVQSDLAIDDNSHEQLINSEPIKPVPVDTLLPMLRELFQAADAELSIQEQEKRQYHSAYQPGMGLAYTPPSERLTNEEDTPRLTAPMYAR